jgi:hypothetical protein
MNMQFADEADAALPKSKAVSVKDDGSAARQSSAIFGMLFTSSAASTADLTTPEAAAAASIRSLLDACPIATVFEHSKYFGPDALHALVAAVAAAGSSGSSRLRAAAAAAPNRGGSSAAAIAAAAAAVPPLDPELAEAALELLMKLAIRNRDRISLLLPLVNEQVRLTVKQTGPDSVALTQRALGGLLRVCERLLMYRQDAEAILGESFQVCSISPPLTCLRLRCHLLRYLRTCLRYSSVSLQQFRAFCRSLPCWTCPPHLRTMSGHSHRPWHGPSCPCSAPVVALYTIS